MTLPTTIKVGGFFYSVQVVPYIGEADHRIQTGVIDYMTCEIKLLERDEWQSQRQTLLHEVIHAILTYCGHYEANSNEEMIDALGNGLYQVLRENPVLVACLLERYPLAPAEVPTP